MLKYPFCVIWKASVTLYHTHHKSLLIEHRCTSHACVAPLARRCLLLPTSAWPLFFLEWPFCSTLLSKFLHVSLRSGQQWSPPKALLNHFTYKLKIQCAHFEQLDWWTLKLQCLQEKNASRWDKTGLLKNKNKLDFNVDWKDNSNFKK